MRKSILITNLLSIIFFTILIIASYNKSQNIIQYNNNSVAIFVTSTKEMKLDLKMDDFRSSNKLPVSETRGIINASVSCYDNNVEYQIIMHNNSSYNKTPGIYNDNIHEYTYEILYDNNIIVNETEIPSYDENSEILLYSEIINNEKIEKKYEIILRFYSTDFNQSKLSGSNINSFIYVKTV